MKRKSKRRSVKMPDILDQKNRKARKQHVCSYCVGIIEKGEIYDWCKLKYENTIYEWKAHKDCMFVAGELWQYIDPYDGMDEDQFCGGCQDFCSVFICPGCEEYDMGECKRDNPYCFDKIVEILKKYELKMKKTSTYQWEFRLHERCDKERKE